MATLTVTPTQTFISGDTVFTADLNKLGQSNVALTAGTIVDADVSASADIAASKLAGTLDLSSKTITLPDSNIGTSKIADAAVTAAKLDGVAKDGSGVDMAVGTAPVFGCRAWVNFNGAVADNLVGTYSRSGNTITVTATAHGLRAGNRADITLAAGTGGTPAASSFEVISVLSANQFTVTDTASGTITGTPTATIKRRLIRASGNVSSVGFATVGAYIINFATELPSDDYAVVGSGRFDNSNLNFNVPVVGLFRGQVSGTPVGVGPTNDFCSLSTVVPSDANAGFNCNLVSIAVFA